MNKIKAIMSNNCLTVVLSDGTMLVNNNASIDLFNKVRSANNEEDVIELMAPELSKQQKEEKREQEEVQKIVDGFDTLVETGDFEQRDGSLYLIGVNRSIPKLLINKFLSVVEAEPFNRVEYTALRNFWMWCCLNPRAEVADKLYEFLEKNAFRINKQGFFFALRNVVTLEPEKSELSKFVSEQYVKIKSWKKNPSNYNVFNDNGYVIVPTDKENHGYNNCIGNLKELYLELPEMEGNRYTDAHTGTFDIRIGKKVSMPYEECSYSTADCAHRGLHFTSNEIHYVGCGDTSVIILINPMTVVGVGQSKGRCYEYLPIAAVSREEATQILHNKDFDTLELEEEYALEQLERLEQRVRENFATEATKYEFNIAPVSSQDIRNIVQNLNMLKDEISKRVVKI